MTNHRPWYDHYEEGVSRTLQPYPEKSLYSLLEEAVGDHPDSPAIAFLGRRLTYQELLSEVERFSAVLAGLGVTKGDRVGLILPNCPQYVIAYYATLRLGAVVVGNNPLYTQRELRHQLSDADCRVVVVLDQLYQTFGAVRSDLEVDHVVATKLTDYMTFLLGLLAPLKFRRDARHEDRPWPPVPEDAEVEWWRDLMKSAGSPPPVAEVDAQEDLAGLIYTGGTTGLSKGTRLTHFNLVTNCIQAEAWFQGVKRGEGGVMCVLPFYHSYGMTVCMNFGIKVAAKLVLVPRFELDRVLKEIDREKPTLFPGIPRLYIALNEAEETKNYDLSSIDACLSGAAPLPLAVAQKFESMTGARVVEGYGLTETSPITHANPINGKRKEGSIGLPFPDTECKLVDLEDRSREVGTGERGELAISGPQVMKGYWNLPEETSQVLQDGWFYTGDIAVMDEEGYFSIVDRKKDMIIVSGFNVYPNEVEDVLYNHPAIQKVSVLGIPDEQTGEAVKAFVVLRQGASATPEEIKEWSRDPEHGLTGYRAPKHVEIRESLPETLTGKVLRRKLLEEEMEKQEA